MLTQREFYYLRHGETDHNVLGLVHHGDISINERGKRQAEKIIRLIGSLPIKTICHSPMKRAKETEAIVTCELLAHRVEIPHLAECSGDVWLEMTRLGYETYQKAEGSVLQFIHQVKEGLNLALSHEGPVLIIAHGGVHFAMCSLMEVEDDWKIDNCVPVHFSLEESRWRARKISLI